MSIQNGFVFGVIPDPKDERYYIHPFQFFKDGIQVAVGIYQLENREKYELLYPEEIKVIAKRVFKEKAIEILLDRKTRFQGPLIHFNGRSAEFAEERKICLVNEIS